MMNRKRIRTTTVVLLVSVAALLLIGIGGRDERVEPLPRFGPVLAGDSVLWEASRPDGERPDGEALLRMWKNGRETSTVYRVRSTPARRDWALSDLTTSGRLVAFNRSWTECPPVPRPYGPRGPGCYRVGADTLTGDVGGQFKTLPRMRCPDERSGDFDIDGSVAAYIESPCTGEGPDTARVVVRDVVQGGPSKVIREADETSVCCDGVRLAGRFAAWSEGSWLRPSVVVFDLDTGKESYRARPSRRAEYSGHLELDIQRDGKVLVAYAQPSLGVLFAQLAWFSPEEPTPHVLPLRALVPEGRGWGGVRLARDEFAVERLRGGGRSELVLADLQGRVVAHLAAFDRTTERWGDFDFDGERVVWSERKTTERSYLECAPGALHCPILERGWITVFLADRKAGWKPRPIARAPFKSFDRT